MQIYDIQENHKNPKESQQNKEKLSISLKSLEIQKKNNGNQ